MSEEQIRAVDEILKKRRATPMERWATALEASIPGGIPPQALLVQEVAKSLGRTSETIQRNIEITRKDHEEQSKILQKIFEANIWQNKQEFLDMRNKTWKFLANNAINSA